MRSLSTRRGFTLVEILIVIAIIATLAAMILGGVAIVRKNTYRAIASSDVNNLMTQVKRYYQDTGKYPGTEYADGDNAFPALFEALFDERPPRGKGGPSAPYMEYRQKDVFVEGDDGTFRQADRDELFDPKVKKYMIDPYGEPYVYRENKSRARTPYMKSPQSVDIYSVGPDGIDQTIEGEEGDDIGSW